jgi:hypothetical protein
VRWFSETTHIAFEGSIQLGFSSLRWLIIAIPNREQMLRATHCASAAGAKRRQQTLLSAKGATHVENMLVRDNTTFLRRARLYKQLACQELTTGISGPIVAKIFQPAAARHKAWLSFDQHQ